MAASSRCSSSGGALPPVILREGHRLRLVFLRGGHHGADFIAQLQAEAAFVAPDGHACYRLRIATRLGAGPFAHLAQQQADRTGEGIVLPHFLARQRQHRVGALLGDQAAETPQLLGLVRHLSELQAMRASPP